LREHQGDRSTVLRIEKVSELPVVKNSSMAQPKELKEREPPHFWQKELKNNNGREEKKWSRFCLQLGSASKKK